MEAMIIIIAALIAIVLLDAGYQIALCLVRWSPSLVLGLFAAWLSDRHGAQALEALWVGALAALITKRVGLPIFCYDPDHWTRRAGSASWRGPAWTRTRNQTVMSGRL